MAQYLLLSYFLKTLHMNLKTFFFIYFTNNRVLLEQLTSKLLFYCNITQNIAYELVKGNILLQYLKTLSNISIYRKTSHRNSRKQQKTHQYTLQLLPFYVRQASRMNFKNNLRIHGRPTRRMVTSCGACLIEKTRLKGITHM